MGILFNHDLVGIGLQFLDEFYGRTVVEQRVRLAEERKFGMIFRPDGLNMNDLSVDLTETVQERSNVLMTGLSPGPCRSQPSACISTMIRPVCSGESSIVRSSSTRNLRFGKIEVLVLLTKPDSPRQVSLIEIFLG